jgi:hypothetical protein
VSFKLQDPLHVSHRAASAVIGVFMLAYLLGESERVEKSIPRLHSSQDKRHGKSLPNLKLPWGSRWIPISPWGSRRRYHASTRRPSTFPAVSRASVSSKKEKAS